MAELALQELPRFPQDGPIRTAIDAKNYKKAIQLIDKRLKSTDKFTEFLLALKTLLMSRMPSVTDNSFVIIRIEEVLEENSTISDLDIIEMYDLAFEEVLPQSQEGWESTIGELRSRFVKANPKDEDAGVECFKDCILKDDLDHAIKIATILAKTFPNKHEYVFWQITSMFLYSKSAKYPEKQRELWSRLALGQIQKLAEAAIQAGEAGSALPIRSIQTPQELLLLHLIKASRGESEQRLQLLNNSHLGPESSIAKGEWQLWIDRLQLLKDLERWQDIFEVTSDLLQRARTKDSKGHLSESRYSDWIVWDKFRTAARKLNQDEYTNKVISELEAHLDPKSGVDKPWKRNAAIIWLEFAFESAPRISNSQLPHEVTLHFGRAMVIIEYLQKYGNTSVAYEDVRPYAEKLNLEERSKLLEILLRNNADQKSSGALENGEDVKRDLSPHIQEFDSADNITKLVNVYKLIYLLTSSIPEHERASVSTLQRICIVCFTPCASFCNTCLSRLAWSTIKSYEKALLDEGNIKAGLLATDRHPADDLTILSAMCLIKLALLTKEDSMTLNGSSTGHWLRATALLEYAWSHSKSNFQISLLLIKMYAYMGCGSLAMRAYQRLNVKQIQHDTLSHCIIDQLSTLHPHPFGDISDDFPILRSPQEQFKEHRKLYSNAPNQVNKNKWKAFQLGSYNSIVELVEFQEHLLNSMTKVMSIVESGRISRLLEPSTTLEPGYEAMLSIPDSSQDGIVDMSDYDTFPDFEAQNYSTQNGNTRFTDIVSSFSVAPYKTRYQANVVRAKLLLLLAAAIAKSGPKETLQVWLQEYISTISHRKHNGTQTISTKPEGRDEIDSITALNNSAYLFYFSLDGTKHSTTEWNEHNDSLFVLLDKRVQQINKTTDSIPAFRTTLELLYTRYELARTATEIMQYISKQASYREIQKDLAQNVEDAAKRLQEAVLAKSATIKAALGESGWMDRVLDSVRQESDDASKDEASSSASVASALVDAVGEGFMEDWAGNIVESWKDSTDGFSYFKAV